jgi:hypothetical protein
MLDMADQLEPKKFRGSISFLRDQTTKFGSLDAIPSAFENALDFLVSQKFAKLHKYEGVDDYVSIDLSDTTKRVLLRILPEFEKNDLAFSMEEKNPKYPIIASYLDVGSAWLYEYASSLSDETGRESIIQSTSWTGSVDRYKLDEEQTKKVIAKIAELKKTIEASDLTQTEKSQASAFVVAALALAESPAPAWEIVKELLILVAAISTSLGLALQIIGMIS